jgi:monothiol glutaredoxin
VKGEFVGGCDIVKELDASGELAKLIGTQAVDVDATQPGKPPTLHLTDTAAAAIKAAAEPGDVLRFEIGPSFRYDLSFGPKQPGDVVVVANGVTIVMDRDTARLADETSIGFVEGEGGGFKITNPNQPASVKQLTAAELKQKIDRGEPVVLIDVRGDAERKIASIAGAKPLEPAMLEALDKGAPIVFHCHHGGRSQAAAERAITMGFKDVSNLKGGIDAWSTSVDPTVKRY